MDETTQDGTARTGMRGRIDALQALRGLRGHVLRALVPAVVLAVVAGSTAGAVSIVALTGAVVSDESAADTARPDDADDAQDTTRATEDSDAAEAADDADAPTPVAAETPTDTDDAPSDVTESPELPELPELTFDETVALHGAPDYPAILTREFPGAQWSLNGSRYAGLVWVDGSPKPTRAQLDALWPAVAATIAEEREAQEAARLAAEQARADELEERRNDPDVQALVDAIDPTRIWGPTPDYSAILSRAFPGAQWSLNGNDPAGGLTWHDAGPAPTKAQLDALWAGVAREMALEMDPVELERHAGVGEQVYVEGVLRPRGWVGGKNDPQPEGSVNAGVDYRYLPQIPNSNNGSPVGTIEVAKDPTGGQNFEQKYGIGVGELAARIAAAHGYFGGSHGLGLSINGDREIMWYSDQVDPAIVAGVLADLGAVTEPEPVPEPAPEPEPEPEPAPEPAPEPEPDPEPADEDAADETDTDEGDPSPEADEAASSDDPVPAPADAQDDGGDDSSEES